MPVTRGSLLLEPASPASPGLHFVERFRNFTPGCREVFPVMYVLAAFFLISL
jgi:hypothetical protein